MSWADDNLTRVFTPEDYWVDGEHRTKEGEVIKIEDMETEHLQRTIDMFYEKYDTTPLEKELDKRELLNKGTR